MEQNHSSSNSKFEIKASLKLSKNVDRLMPVSSIKGYSKNEFNLIAATYHLDKET